MNITTTKSGKMKKVSKKLQNFIDSISTIADSKIGGDNEKIYISKVDGSYLTIVGCENDVNILLRYGITEQIQSGQNEPITCSIGFNPKEQKWYGWSHRGIFGFGIGSRCKLGHCGYSASNKKDFAEQNLVWFGEIGTEESYLINPKVKEHTKNGVLGVLVEYDYNDKVPNESMRGTHCEEFAPYPVKWGKGDWTANTIDEAKEMAKDFAEGVG
jgi:hypothetical protein